MLWTGSRERGRLPGTSSVCGEIKGWHPILVRLGMQGAPPTPGHTWVPAEDTHGSMVVLSSGKCVFVLENMGLGDCILSLHPQRAHTPRKLE
jgi:hypothetical protein